MNLAQLIMRVKSEKLRRYAVRLAGQSGLNRGSPPDFIIVGAQKAGTTSLYGYLQEHPDVLPAAGKELHFFSGAYAKGEKWYERRFLDSRDLRPSTVVNDRRLISGEATPYYLFHPHVPARIAKLRSKPKLIALLRDPVARAYSQYQHNVRKGKEALPFEEALQREDAILPQEQARMEADPTYKSVAHGLYSYKARGRYAEQLERYYRFFPREQLLIVKSEDLFEDPQQTHNEILSFLGLPNVNLKSATPLNIGNYNRGPDPILESLRSYFQPHNRRLYDLLGRDMGW